MKKLNEELSTINFTTEFLDDSEDVMRNYIGYVKNDDGDDEYLTSVNMYWDELSGGDDEDFDKEDEDSVELPYFEYTFSDEGADFYRANKSFFDKFFADKGFVLGGVKDEDEEDDGDNWGKEGDYIIFGKDLDVSPTMRTVKKLTKEYIDAMKKAGVVLPGDSTSSDDEDDIDEWLTKESATEAKGLKESLTRSKPKAKTPSYVDDDTSLLDSISRIK